MKKTTILLSIFVFIFCFSACNTTPRQPVNIFEPSLDSPSITIGEAEMQFDRPLPFPGIRKMVTTVSYFPQEDAVCLRWRMNMITFHLFFSYESRETFITSLAQYKEDFEARNFGKSSRKTRRVYGNAPAYVIWQNASFTVRARASSVLDYGYFFVEGAPYFTVTQRDVEYIDGMHRDNNRQLKAMPIYFTRAQADALAELLDEDFLKNVTISTPSRVMEIDFDDY